MRGLSPAPSRYGLRWTAEEDKALIWQWGRVHVELIAKRLHRGPEAVIARVRRLGLDCRKNADEISLCELSRQVGRGVETVRRIVRQLGIQLRLKPRKRPRSSRNTRKLPWNAKRYAFTLAEAQRVIDKLRPLAGVDVLTVKALGAWSLKYPCCVRCGKTDSKYKRNGMCMRCTTHVDNMARGEGRSLPDKYDGYVCLSVLGHEFTKSIGTVCAAASIAGVEVLRGKRMYYVTLEAAEKVREVLAKGGKIIAKPHISWGIGVRPEACKRCGKNDKLYRARGYCAACYEWLHRRGLHAT